MANPSLLAFLKLVMVLICAVWVSLWVLKPTQVWTRKWKQAEESAAATVFGYNGTNFQYTNFDTCCQKSTLHRLFFNAAGNLSY